MPLIIPPGFAQITVPMRHSALAREAVFTFGVDWSGGSLSDVQKCDAICVTVEFVWGSFIDNEVTVGQVQASIGQDGDDNLAVEGTYTFTGDSTGEKMPPNVALLVRKLTSRGGRRGRGRMFLPWVLTDGVVNDVGGMEAGDLADYQTAAELFRTELETTNELPMYLLHGSGGSTPGAPNPITSLSVDSVVGTQRRRLGR